MFVKIIYLIIFTIGLIASTYAFAVPLTSQEMGFMVVSDYGYFIAMLGIVCAFVFILGIHQ